MNKKLRKAILRALAGLSINLSAGWFGAAFITPNIADISEVTNILRLIYDVFLGIIFLGITIFIENKQ
ncbi:hypothetical protein A2767_03860 [Candidatus Roizmanbacteria bacterium RIFCSPHIGHO2_01_FULL_35_10]|uniref:Uncharacterized protein n=1 Tax=Candidatus Roizmanbacteria bacterium RIFCSPLOWO2_01_FULL_35_13 TaxID=1802055 RepID=A0A1F7IA76_9BACT|nr:MAG: hypothetical protein A2767_03860 [Candidatus Roizmanbacteria bacterium RIFCSPHIGHO2_01_FULL_35_10]OGK40260.1 MAG: hypothetical protein A3A74_07175 [Candidatus Roizmanbacteria bacterium RIFCSPLOWO2_01_FULL_35_13]